MTALASFGANQALESMLTFATWQREFREADRRALKEALGTIRTAMVQPVGATERAKARDCLARLAEEMGWGDDGE